jgi:hypothetical protein
MSASCGCQAAGRPPVSAPRSERILLLGWSELGPRILKELDDFVQPGSQAFVWADPDLVGAPVHVHGLRNLDLEALGDGAVTRDGLRELMTERDIDHVVVLCYRGLSLAEADARALMLLLQARGAAASCDRQVNVVTELLDSEDVGLAAAGSTDGDEFILSERLTSLVMAQLAENPRLEDVFRDLLDAAGSELALRPTADYGVDATHRFEDVVRAAARRNELAIGYRTRGGPVLNPDRDAALGLGPEDHLIVLAD